MARLTKGSKSFSLGREDWLKIRTTVLFSVASTLVAVGIIVLGSPEAEFPVWFIPLIPVTNTLLYALKRFVEDNR